MALHPPGWGEVASPATTQGDLGDGFREDTIRLSTTGEPGLERFWPIPLYGVAYIVHKRYRLWRPRVLPTLTSLTLRGMYGALALGHAADIEASRLRDKLIRGADKDRLWIHLYCAALRTGSHGLLERVKKEAGHAWPSRLTWPDLTYPRDFRPAEFLIELYEFYLWRLRSLWSDEPSRQLASVILRDAIVKHGMSEHDAHILVRTVAEALYAGQGNLVSRTVEGRVPFAFAGITMLGLYARWRVLPIDVRVFCTMWQWTLFQVWVYRTLWGRYHHWESLRSLEDPAKAVAVMEAAVEITERVDDRQSESEVTPKM